MASKKGVIMYYDLLEQLEDFTDEQFGKITRAIIKYDKTGELTEFDDPTLKVAFKIFKPALDRNKQEYEEICEKRREAGALGGKQKQANASKCYQNLANLADKDKDIDNDIDIKKKENILKERQSDSKTQSISTEQVCSLEALTKENIIPSNQTDLEEQSLSGIQTLPIDSAIKKIYDYWNTLNIVVHRKLTPNINKAIKKALENYSEEEIENAMDNYQTILNDKEYYFDYIWGLETFLKQKNCLPHFVDSGEKWLSYCAKKGIKQKEQNKTEYKVDKNGLISL